MRDALKRALTDALGSPVARASSLAGGDINEAFAVDLADGRTVFVKTHPNPPPTMFAAEAEGLAWLREAAALRVPDVIATSEANGGPHFLVLQMLTPGRRCADFDERLGRGLAALHRYGAAGFGLHRSNFIGRLPQDNTPRGTWAEFYRDRRIVPQVRLADERRLLDRPLRRRLDQLCERLAELVGPQEPAARLHGDLWGGNLHVDPDGSPCLIDPAVYGGHREVDLAMMRLFGGFSQRCFAAYAEAYPLSAGQPERVPLYQLYPLLVHVNLFGGSYVGSVQQAVSRYV